MDIAIGIIGIVGFLILNVGGILYTKYRGNAEMGVK